jgi:hypothetical protein
MQQHKQLRCVSSPLALQQQQQQQQLAKGAAATAAVQQQQPRLRLLQLLLPQTS